MYSTIFKHTKIPITLFVLFVSIHVKAQIDVKIGTNPGIKTPSAVLELESTTKGFLLPRMTEVQIKEIKEPAEGLMVYNLDQGCSYYFHSGGWYSACAEASNGLTKSGNTILLGGVLTNATTLTTDATQTLAISGLQKGSDADNIVVLDPTTGVLRRRAVGDVVTNSNVAWLLGGNTLTGTTTIGSNSNHDVGIKTNGTTRLTITNAGAISQTGTGQVTFTGNVDATNGLDVTTGALTANAGSTLTGATNINTTGAAATNIGNATSATTVLGATTINSTGSSATTIGNSASTVSVAGTTSVSGATTINTTGAAATSIGNSASTVSVAGTTSVTGATNINTTGAATTTIGNASATTTIVAPNLNITGLTAGAATDYVVTTTAAGATRRVPMSDVVSSGLTVNNGLTKTGNNVQLGGTLVQATNIEQAGNTLNITGGNVAIGSSDAPNSTLQLTGSFAISYRKEESDMKVSERDHIVLGNATNNPLTIYLPDPEKLTGRVYYVGKTDETTNDVIFSPELRLTEKTYIKSINFAKKYRIVSDGKEWWVISE